MAEGDEARVSGCIYRIFYRNRCLLLRGPADAAPRFRLAGSSSLFFSSLSRLLSLRETLFALFTT